MVWFQCDFYHHPLDSVAVAQCEMVVVFDVMVAASYVVGVGCGVVLEEFDVVQVVSDVVCDGAVVEKVECLVHDHHPTSCHCLGSVTFQHWRAGSHSDHC